MSDNTLTGCWRLEQVGQHSSDEDDLFSLMKSRRSEGTGELEGYLACVSVNMDLLNAFQNIKKLSDRHSSDEDDLFSLMKSRRSEGTGELEGYLACVSVNMDLLNAFQNIKKLSLTLNTRRPASAACEQL